MDSPGMREDFKNKYEMSDDVFVVQQPLGQHVMLWTVELVA